MTKRNATPLVPEILDDAPPDFVKPLSKAETKRREELEEIVTRNFNAFYDVGCALREIHQKALFRNTHVGFGDYCKDLWEMGRRHAYRMIDAAEIVDNIRLITQGTASRDDNEVCPIGHTWVPENENQARALVKFKEQPEAIKTIVTEAVKTAPDGKITASHIKKTARRLHMVKVKKTIAKAKKKANQAPKIGEKFRKAFNNFLDAINVERAEEYKNTDRKEVIRSVQVILDALEAEL